MNDDGTSTVYMQNTHKRGREHDVRAAGTTPNTSTVANENRDQAHLRSEPSSLLCKEGRSRKRLRVTDCPWTDAVQAPTVWALVVDYMLAKVYALDRSSFGGGADKGHLRAARTLLRIGSTCRALYTCIGGLCMRLDALVGIEDDTDEKSLLWCAVARTDVTPHEATFDTDHAVYHSLLHIERLVMRSGHLCARDLDRPFGCTVVVSSTVDLSAPAEDDAVRPMLIVAKAKSCKDDIDDVDDDQKENDKERNDKDADKEECESDDDEDDDEDQDSSDEDSDDDDDDESRPFKSMIDIPSYQDLWDQVKWPRAKDLHSGDENDNGSEDEEFEDYGDTHEEEEGTLSQQDSKGRNWTLTIYSHYHHGLTLVDVQIVP